MDIPVAAPALAPVAVPRTNPLPAPTAAPMPGFPAAAPMAAPSAPPSSVPIVAPLTALLATGSFAPAPLWLKAHCRQESSSTWKTSNGLPEPGKTITLGPAGTVAQAPSSGTTATSKNPADRLITAMSSQALQALVRAYWGCGATCSHWVGHCGTDG
jgi:hypothetical protein